MKQLLITRSQLLFLLLVFPVTVWSAHNTPPSTQNRGCPDSWGYTWIDNDNEPNGPTFNWIDIATPANNTHINGAGSWSLGYNIGFSYPFYGGLRTLYNINTNGILSFSHPAQLNRWAINVLSTELAVDTASTTASEGIYTWYNNDISIVQWNAHTVSSGRRVKFEVILISNGDCFLQYDTINVATGDYFVSLEAGLIYFNMTDSATVATGSVIHIFAPGNSSAHDFVPVPNTFTIQVFPNPFNSMANVRISTFRPGNAEINLYDINGRFVRSLYNGGLGVGTTMFHFNADGLASSSYFVRMKNGTEIRSVPILYLK